MCSAMDLNNADKTRISLDKSTTSNEFDGSNRRSGHHQIGHIDGVHRRDISDGGDSSDELVISADADLAIQIRNIEAVVELEVRECYTVLYARYNHTVSYNIKMCHHNRL